MGGWVGGWVGGNRKSVMGCLLVDEFMDRWVHAWRGWTDGWMDGMGGWVDG